MALDCLNRVRKEWWRSIRPSEIAFREERKKLLRVIFSDNRRKFRIDSSRGTRIEIEKVFERGRKPALSSDGKNEFHLLKPFSLVSRSKKNR